MWSKAWSQSEKNLLKNYALLSLRYAGKGGGGKHSVLNMNALEWEQSIVNMNAIEWEQSVVNMNAIEWEQSVVNSWML